MSDAASTRLARGVADALALGVLVLAGWVLLARVASASGQCVTWADRDLVRSAVPFWELPTCAAELSYGLGARVPGGFFHTLLWGVLRVTDDPAVVWQVQVGLDALAVALLALAVGWRWGLVGAAVAAATFVGADADALTQVNLWNPAWLPLWTTLAVLAWARVVAVGDARWLPVVTWLVALSAQLHVSALLLVPALLPGVVLARPSRAGRWALASVATFALAYAPHVVDEALHGWPNTRLLLDPVQLSDHRAVVSADARPLATAASALGALGGEGNVGVLVDLGSQFGAAQAVARAGALLSAIALLAVCVARRGADAAGVRVARGAGAGALVIVLWLARARPLAFLASDAVRYLLVAVPVLALAVGVAVGVAHAWATSRGGVRAWLSTAVVALVLASGAVRLWAVHVRSDAMGGRALTCGRIDTWVDGVGAVLGATPAEVSGRTVLVMPQGDGSAPRDVTAPITWKLAAAGATFPGSLPPPCALVVGTGWDAPGYPLDAAFVARAVGPDTPPVTVLETSELARGLTLVTYAPASGRCPTNMTNRYLVTPEEARVRPRMYALGRATAERLDDGDGVLRWAAVLDAAPSDPGGIRVPALLVLTRAGDVATVTLHANGLRGHAWNAGFFADARILAPRLVATDASGVEVGRLVLSDGVVGQWGEATPITASGTLPAGASLSLVYEAQPGGLDGRRLFEPTRDAGPVETVTVALP